MTGDKPEPEWLHAHAHEPNPGVPTGEPAFTVAAPGFAERSFAVADLDKLPQSEVSGCYIVSTGHGSSGPFSFGGVCMADVVAAVLPPDTAWQEADVISADGFGNRVHAEELAEDAGGRPILLATRLDGRPLTRAEGLIRLIVPGETDDALRQVKWVGRIEIR